MGLSGLGALIALGLAFLALSPRLTARMGLFGWGLRLRTFVGYAFAFLLLSLGFFLAGVPLGEEPIAAEATDAAGSAATGAGAEVSTDVPESTVQADLVIDAVTSTVTGTPTPSSSTRTSGAFAPLASATASISTEESTLAPTRTPRPAAEPVDTPETASPTTTPTATTTATPTSTSTPTTTPTPTMTPTPIEGETAQIDTQGSTLWVRRSPSGQTLALVTDGDTVILLPGHANQAGILWQEVSTLSGVTGWVQLEFLSINEE
jgi:cytoskeletal protein RodZ